jgi:hypothetical protein
MAIVSSGRRAEKVCGRVRKIPGALGRDQDDGSGAVVFHAAIEQPKRLHDPARLIILLLAKRLAAHEGARIGLRMMIGGERDRAQRSLLDVVLFHETSHLRGKALCWRYRAVRDRESHLAGNHGRRPILAERHPAVPVPCELPLSRSAKYNDAIRKPAGNRGAGMSDSSRRTAATSTPLHA